MRIFLLPLLLLASCASPPAPTSAYDRPITLELRNVSAHEAIDQIARRSSLSVMLNPDLGHGTITMSVKDKPAGQVLEAVAATCGLKVTRETHDIVRISKP
jgi:hypothetical protein